jgi:hypothetical protein
MRNFSLQSDRDQNSQFRRKWVEPPRRIKAPKLRFRTTLRIGYDFCARTGRFAQVVTAGGPWFSKAEAIENARLEWAQMTGVMQ